MTGSERADTAAWWARELAKTAECHGKTTLQFFGPDDPAADLVAEYEIPEYWAEKT